MNSHWQKAQASDFWQGFSGIYLEPIGFSRLTRDHP